VIAISVASLRTDIAPANRRARLRASCYSAPTLLISLSRFEPIRRFVRSRQRFASLGLQWKSATPYRIADGYRTVTRSPFRSTTMASHQPNSTVSRAITSWGASGLAFPCTRRARVVAVNGPVARRAGAQRHPTLTPPTRSAGSAPSSRVAPPPLDCGHEAGAEPDRIRADRSGREREW
jgi:hypothetical protein